MNRVCHYYQSGSCRNGDSCLYYHPRKKCRNFQKGCCPYGYSCYYWHAPSEKMVKDHEPPRKICVFYMNGQCKYGDTCCFEHDIDKIKHTGQTLNEYQAVTKKLGMLNLSRDSLVVPHTNALSGSVSSVNEDFSDCSSRIKSVDETLRTPLDFAVDSGPCVSFIPATHSREMPEQSSHVKTTTESTLNRTAFERPNQAATSVNAADATDNEIHNLQTLEVNRLLKWFTREKVKESTHPQGGRFYFVNFSSTDPDWGYDVREITLKFYIDLIYPKKPLVVTVCQEDCLPFVLVEHLNTSIAAWIQKEHERLQKNGRLGIYLKKLLQWLDRNLEELFTQGLRKFKQKLLNDHVSMSKSAETSDTDSTTSTFSLDANEGIDCYETSNSDVNASVESNRLNSEARICTNQVDKQMQALDSLRAECCITDSTTGSEHQRKGDAIPQKSEVPETHTLRLADMRLLGSTGIYVQSHLFASLHCARCKLPFTWKFHFHGNMSQFATSTGAADPSLLRSLPPHNLACTRCRHPMVLFFKATIAHANDNLVGAFHLSGCVVDDIPFGQSSCILSCSDCSQYIKIKTLIPGRGTKRYCFSCHALIGLDFSRFLLEARILPGVADTSVPVCAQKDRDVHDKEKSNASRGKRHSLKANQKLTIKDGLPLPFFGACEHYRKSHRWLRFPCCGLLQPCDVCHDKATGDSHEMEMATRMVCGFCSKEQAFSATRPCSRCGAGLTGSKSAHWEGGKGCRNKVTMSRKDAKKYSQSDRKTVSKK